MSATGALFSAAALLLVGYASCCNMPSIEHGYTEPRRPWYWQGSTVKFKCMDGYYMKGMDSAKCGDDDNWMGDMPKCYKYCENPRSFFGGYFYPDKPHYKYEDKVYYKCPRYDEKYIYSTCDMDGSWKQASKCHDYCKMPEIEHGYHEPMKDKYYYGDMIKYKCKDKYQLYYDGDMYDMTKCGEDGNWDMKKPMCKKYCKAPDYKMYHHYPYAKSMYKEGDKMYYYCKDGYYRPKQYSYYMAMCMDGEWDKMPYKCEMRCTAHDYSDYHHMPYKKEHYGYGEKMMYKCKDGYYKPSGYDYDGSMCGSDGNWDKKPYKCMKYCKHKPMMHGKYSVMKDMYKYNDKVTYDCDYGYMKYYPDGEYEYNMCDKHGNWKHMPPMCKKYCKMADIMHGYYKPMMKHYNVGDKVKYGCKDGYRLFYQDVWYEYNMCKDNGKWEYMEPMCKMIEDNYCDPPRIMHGMYEPMKAKYMHGDKISFKCKEGYKLFYDDVWYEYNTCMKGNKWEYDPPMCKKLDMKYCKAPYIAHGSYEPMKKMYSEGDRIYYKCKEGYKLYYDKDWYEYASCMKDGYWDFDPPKCRPESMKHCMPDEFMHGEYKPKMKMYMPGDRMYYRCEMGYGKHHDDDSYEYRTCGDEGMWDFKPPMCRKVYSTQRLYCMAPMVKHGSAMPKKQAYSHGEKIYYECDEGYMKYYKGDRYHYSMCKSDGMWDKEPPMCKSKYKNYCYPPQMMKGSYYPMMKMYNYGDRLRYKCDKGYEMYYHGEPYEYATCGKDGYWDMKPPMCKSKKMNYCMGRMMEHGMYVPMMKMYSPGDRLRYKCKEGYRLFYEKDWFEYNVCKDDGMWLYMHPMCKMAQKAYCDPPKIDHGMYNPMKRIYSFGDMVSYSCKDGYKLYYEDKWFEMSTCKPGGYWYPKPPMCKEMMKKYCYPPEYYHGSYYPDMRKYMHGERMYYKCDKGYKKMYDGEMYEYNTCMDGKWMKMPPKCVSMKKKYCKPPMVMHGTYMPMKKMYYYGDRVWYRCNAGYYKHFDGDYYEYSTCMEDGMWDKMPHMCKMHDKKYCMPKDLMHGGYFPKKEKYNYGERVYYWCNAGYDVKYKQTWYEYVTCQSGGMWDNEPPMCMDKKKKQCSKPSVMHSSYKPMKDMYKHGDRVYIMCDYGYYKYYSGHHHDYSTCKDDGNWDMLPECKMMAKKYCKAPDYEMYKHKSYAKKKYMAGEWIKYECADGYYSKDMKYNYAICQPDGKWNYEPKMCYKYCMGSDVKYGKYSPMKKYYMPGERVSYMCMPGYSMKYHGSRYEYMTCKADGNWDDKAPMCMKYCSAPSDYKNGYYWPRQTSFGYGDMIYFQCYRGYKMSSDMNYSSCGSNGMWKMDFPKCYY